jgi:hypothetical protein
MQFSGVTLHWQEVLFEIEWRYLCLIDDSKIRISYTLSWVECFCSKRTCQYEVVTFRLLLSVAFLRFLTNLSGPTFFPSSGSHSGPYISPIGRVPIGTHICPIFTFPLWAVYSSHLQGPTLDRIFVPSSRSHSGPYIRPIVRVSLGTYIRPIIRVPLGTVYSSHLQGATRDCIFVPSSGCHPGLYIRPIFRVPKRWPRTKEKATLSNNSKVTSYRNPGGSLMSHEPVSVL